MENGRGKKRAKEIYAGVMKRGEATSEQLLANAIAYRAACTSRDSKYIKHPKTWLNDGRWEDEATEAKAPDTEGINWVDHFARFRETKSWLPALART
jgi:hypothetical protein